QAARPRPLPRRAHHVPRDRRGSRGAEGRRGGRRRRGLAADPASPGHREKDGAGDARWKGGRRMTSPTVSDAVATVVGQMTYPLRCRRHGVIAVASTREEAETLTRATDVCVATPCDAPKRALEERA